MSDRITSGSRFASDTLQSNDLEDYASNAGIDEEPQCGQADNSTPSDTTQPRGLTIGSSRCSKRRSDSWMEEYIKMKERIALMREERAKEGMNLKAKLKKLTLRTETMRLYHDMGMTKEEILLKMEDFDKMLED